MPKKPYVEPIPSVKWWEPKQSDRDRFKTASQKAQLLRETHEYIRELIEFLSLISRHTSGEGPDLGANSVANAFYKIAWTTRFDDERIGSTFVALELFTRYGQSYEGCRCAHEFVHRLTRSRVKSVLEDFDHYWRSEENRELSNEARLELAADDFANKLPKFKRQFAGLWDYWLPRVTGVLESELIKTTCHFESTPALRPRHQQILELCDGNLLKQTEIAIDLDVSLRTIANDCIELENLGLLHRPDGERKGYTKKI